MPKWISLPPEKLLDQPDQQRFLTDRRRRICKVCKTEFSIPPSTGCPTCNGKGIRLFDRLTILAGRRYGKSRFGSIAGTEEACIPNTIGWACAPTNPKLHRYVIPAFQKLIPNEWVANWSTEFNDLTLKNGSLIHFQTLEDPDQGRGQGLDWLWIDEICELTLKHWEVISPSLADQQGVAFFTTSPRSYDWVYEEFYKPAEDGVPGYWACRAKTNENPKFQSDEGREYLARERERMSDAMYRQEYEADFVTFTGAVYGDSIIPQILRNDDQIRAIIPEWPKVEAWRQVLIGIDTGADHPFGGVKLISSDKGLVVIGEYLERDKTFAEHALSLRRLAGSNPVKWAINKNERQPMLELAQPQHNIVCQPAEHDIVAGTERVKTWLYNKQLWFAESCCPRTIKQLQAYRWAENTSPKTGESRAKEKVYKKNDELPDCLRYALMTWPQLPKVVVNLDKKRDLSKLPEEMRGAIQRMRRIDDEPKEPTDVVGDFYM